MNVRSNEQLENPSGKNNGCTIFKKSLLIKQKSDIQKSPLIKENKSIFLFFCTPVESGTATEPVQKYQKIQV